MKGEGSSPRRSFIFKSLDKFFKRKIVDDIGCQLCSNISTCQKYTELQDRLSALEKEAVKIGVELKVDDIKSSFRKRFIWVKNKEADQYRLTIEHALQKS